MIRKVSNTIHCRYLSQFLKNRQFTCAERTASSSAKSQPQSGAEYCMNIVRKYDYENFLCSLLLPLDTRSAAFAIRAFNIEIAQVRDVVTNRDIGRMRMQFWKDSLETIFAGKPPQQPVALELNRILRKRKLSKQWFRRIIESRESRLNDQNFLNMKSLEDYCEKSVSSVNYLILESAEIKNIHADHTASHLGKAQGIVVLLRGIPFNVSRNRVYLPQDLMIKYGVSHEDILRRKTEKKVKDLVFEIASTAHQHLKIAKSFKKELSKNTKPIFLPAVACRLYLENLEKYEFDTFHPKLQARNSSLPMVLWWNKLKSDF